MKQYLLSVYQPDADPPRPEALDPIMWRVDAWADDLRAAGGRVFTARLHPPSTATVVRSRDGQVLMTDGPFTEGEEHIGGFTVIRAPDLDAAIDWGHRLGDLLGLPVEIRPIRDGAG
jgi:hypothetical protein